MKSFTLALILLLSLLANTSVAQSDDIRSDDFLNFPMRRFMLQYDARYAFLGGKQANIIGVRAGISYKEKHRFGMGFYTLASAERFTDAYLLVNETGEIDSVNAWPSFRYASIFYEYVWLKNGKWEISTPINLGTGRASINYASKPTETQEIEK